jgi:SAM-dependent methyltransferase
MTSAPSYDRSFMEYAAQSSAYGAHAVTSLLAPLLKVSSVLDVGCAAGTWLRHWQQQNVSEIHGVDGDYLDRQQLEIDQKNFSAADLNQAFDLGRRFDLAQSLEVAEHVRTSSSEQFVDNLTRHAGRFVLFGAAPPGQGGEYHINEQPYDFWRTHFSRRGFVALDFVRPAIVGDVNISYWYRYNTVLYVRRESLAELPSELRNSLVPDDVPLSDISPPGFRLRKALVRLLPYALQHQVAKFKSRMLPSGRI